MANTIEVLPDITGADHRGSDSHSGDAAAVDKFWATVAQIEGEDALDSGWAMTYQV